MKFEVLKQSHVKRNIIIGVGVILILVACILTFTRAKYRVTESIPLVNGTINYTIPDIQIVGLYINGEEAEELDSAKSYTLDTAQSTCTYKDGTTIDNLTLNYNSGTKTFTIAPYTTKGTKCTLFFDESNKATDIIEGLEPNNQDILAYDDYGNLRYIGADPNNYVSFNGELWRIIGIMNNVEKADGTTETLVKIIRDGLLDNIAWDSAGVNDWSTASLQTTLNGDYLNGTGSYTSTGITSDTARNMIENVTWNLGGVSYSNHRTAISSEWYNYERGTEVYNGNPTTWTGKVALMYPSDYGYATSGGATTDRATCLATSLLLWETSSTSDCHTNDWLYKIGEVQWMITTSSDYSELVFCVETTGFVDYYYFVNDTWSVHPSVYLTSEVKISSGDGSASNPYVLTM